MAAAVVLACSTENAGLPQRHRRSNYYARDPCAPQSASGQQPPLKISPHPAEPSSPADIEHLAQAPEIFTSTPRATKDLLLDRHAGASRGPESPPITTSWCSLSPVARVRKTPNGGNREIIASPDEGDKIRKFPATPELGDKIRKFLPMQLFGAATEAAAVEAAAVATKQIEEAKTPVLEKETAATAPIATTTTAEMHAANVTTAMTETTAATAATATTAATAATATPECRADVEVSGLQEAVDKEKKLKVSVPKLQLHRLRPEQLKPVEISSTWRKDNIAPTAPASSAKVELQGKLAAGAAEISSTLRKDNIVPVSSAKVELREKPAAGTAGTEDSTENKKPTVKIASLQTLLEGPERLLSLEPSPLRSRAKVDSNPVSPIKWRKEGRRESAPALGTDNLVSCLTEKRRESMPALGSKVAQLLQTFERKSIPKCDAAGDAEPIKPLALPSKPRAKRLSRPRERSLSPIKVPPTPRSGSSNCTPANGSQEAAADFALGELPPRLSYMFEHNDLINNRTAVQCAESTDDASNVEEGQSAESTDDASNVEEVAVERELPPRVPRRRLGRRDWANRKRLPSSKWSQRRYKKLRCRGHARIVRKASLGSSGTSSCASDT